MKVDAVSSWSIRRRAVVSASMISLTLFAVVGAMLQEFVSEPLAVGGALVVLPIIWLAYFVEFRKLFAKAEQEWRYP